MERFAPFGILVRALLWPMAEELRIGIVADIATVTAMTKTTASNVQAGLTAGANLPGGFDALFGVLLQQLAQPAAPANDSAQSVAANDITNAQTDPQTAPQASRQTPQGFSKLIALLKNAAPQRTVQIDENVGTQPTAAGKTDAVPDETAKNDPASAAAMPLAARLQSGDVIAMNTMTAATPAAPNAQPMMPDAPRKAGGAKPAAKDDQPKAADSDPTADPKIAPDANLVAALTQQMQAVAASAPPVGPVSDKQTPLRAQPQSIAAGAVTSANAASTDATQAAAGNSGALANGASNIDAPKADAAKPDAKSSDAPPPSLPAAVHEATSARNGQSSVTGQTTNTTPSVPATGIQAQVQTANAASINVNLQVAPQRHSSEAASPPALDTLGVTIAAKSADGVKHFNIRLDPPELGRVEVLLSLDDSGKAQASLVVDKPQTLELLQRDAANLTRSLNDAGVSLSNNGLNFSLRGQERQSDGGVVKGRGRVLSVKALVGTDAISNSSSIASLAPDSVRLDIRV